MHTVAEQFDREAAELIDEEQVLAARSPRSDETLQFDIVTGCPVAQHRISERYDFRDDDQGLRSSLL